MLIECTCITCSRHRSLQKFEFQLSKFFVLIFLMILQQTIWGIYYIRKKERFCDSKVIDTTFDQAKIIITKDLDNWNLNFWRLQCREQVSTFLNQIKLVYGLIWQSKMHSALDFCSRLARKENNVPLHKRS